MTHAQQITGGGGSATGCSFLHMPYPSPSPSLSRAYNVHGIIATPPASLKQLVPSTTNSVCLHLRIIDACREASLTASQSQLSSSPFPFPFPAPSSSLSWLSCLSCLSWLVGDNNNSSELRAGWEMPLICSSCQLSRSEMKWKSHALMADDEAGPLQSPCHSTPLTPCH